MKNLSFETAANNSTEKKVQNLGLTAELFRKPKITNQQLQRNRLKL